MSNFWKRILTAAVAVPILYVIFRLGGVIYLVFIMALVLIGQLEYSNLLKSRKIPHGKYAGIILSLLLIISSYFGFIYFSLFFTLSVVLVLITGLKKALEGDTIARAGATLLGIVYLGWLLGHAVLVRNISDMEGIELFSLSRDGLSDPGFFYIFFTVACTFLNDTGAYFTGLYLGRHKLSPRISPGKTVEGTIGGVAACILTGLVVNYGFGSPLNSDWTILFSVVIAAAAIFGDLVESSIKRGAGIKDSGAIVPGHGGVLDRFDSLIFVFPVSYYFILIYYISQGVSFG